MGVRWGTRLHRDALEALMSKVIQGLIAAAVGVALGLSVDCAQAANVPADEVTPQERKLAERVCVRAGGGVFVCAMTHAASEMDALVDADLALAQCEWSDRQNKSHEASFRCVETRAYIKQRWGY